MHIENIVLWMKSYTVCIQISGYSYRLVLLILTLMG